MNYIFLDIDGVLNDGSYILLKQDEDGALDEKMVELFAMLVKQFDARIVLCSNWRHGFTDNMKPRMLTIRYFDGTQEDSRCTKLLKMLNKYGVRLHSKTSEAFANRPDAVFAYVQENLEGEDKYVIIDDDFGESYPEIMAELAPHLVQPDFNKGFDEKCYVAVAKIFNN